MTDLSPPPPPPIRPRPSATPDRLVRTLSRSGGLAVKTIVASELAAEALSLRPHASTAAHALGRALMGGLLIAAGSSDAEAEERDVESVQLQLRGDGPLGRITVIADSRARVRGSVQHPATEKLRDDGRPNLAAAVGLGPLHVVRHRPRWRSPYTGTVPLVTGEIAGDLTLYLTESEQIPSAMGLGLALGPGMSDVAACGFLVQVMPDATDEEIARMERNVAGLPGLAALLEQEVDASDLADRLLAGLGSRDHVAISPRFTCPCSRDRAIRTLALLEPGELEDMVVRDESQEVVCEFCGRSYEIRPPEMAPLISQPLDAGTSS